MVSERPSPGCLDEGSALLLKTEHQPLQPSQIPANACLQTPCGSGVPGGPHWLLTVDGSLSRTPLASKPGFAGRGWGDPTAALG